MHSFRPGDAETAAPEVETKELIGRRICIVLAALGAGGAERVVAWLARQLAKQGAAVTIVSFDSPSDPVYHDFGGAAALVRLDIPAYRTDGSALPAPVRRVLALRRFLRDNAPDVAVGFLTKINTILLAAAIGLRVRVVVSERNNPRMQPAHWAWQRALHLLYGRANRIICQTAASRACIPRAWHRRIEVIPNPVPACGARRRCDGQRRIAGVGRLERQKGFDVLIRAFAAIAAERVEWSLDIWGEGPELKALTALASRMGVAGRVAFRGLSERPGGWIEETDLFVLSSRYEGFPNVLGEAMAAGLPVIATDCDFGPAELIISGRSGLLVPSDDPDAMAAALARLTGDGALRQRLGAAARDVTRRYSADTIAAMWCHAIGGAAP